MELGKTFTECAVLLLGGPVILAVFDFHEMDVPMIGYELTWVPDPGQRLAGWC